VSPDLNVIVVFFRRNPFLSSRLDQQGTGILRGENFEFEGWLAGTLGSSPP